MENKRGICYIAFGKEYDRTAAYTIARSLPFIPVPVTVFTNLKTRDKKWNGLSNINFVYIDLPDERNREIKTQLYKYSPYDETLYADCDSVVVRPGIEKIFDCFDNKNLILQSYGIWTENKRYYKIYRESAKKIGIELPLNIYIGGFFAFKKAVDTAQLFNLWNEYWELFGSGRDMPALCCAVKNNTINHATVTTNDRYFFFGVDNGAVIVHPRNSKQLHASYGIPEYVSDKKFDIVRPDDWTMVFWDDERTSIINNGWVKIKFNRQKRLLSKNKYISKYLPEIKRGGFDILDIATGPGEFIELALKYKNNLLGIEYNSGMITREKDVLYEKYNAIAHRERLLPVIYCDFNKIVTDGHEKINGNKYDIINCQHAINFIARDIFTYHTENSGEWLLGENFYSYFNSFFVWCKNHLQTNGVIMLAALHARNEAEYTAIVKQIAIDNGFTIEIEDRNIEHKFRLAA